MLSSSEEQWSWVSIKQALLFGFYLPPGAILGIENGWLLVESWNALQAQYWKQFETLAFQPTCIDEDLCIKEEADDGDERILKICETSYDADGSDLDEDWHSEISLGDAQLYNPMIDIMAGLQQEQSFRVKQVCRSKGLGIRMLNLKIMMLWMLNP